MAIRNQSSVLAGRQDRHPRRMFQLSKYRFDARHRSPVPLVGTLLLFLLLCPRICFAADNTLAIIGAGVQRSEDGAFVGRDYQFLPGDFVYFTFQIAGYKAKSNDQDDTRKIALTYEITPEDEKGVPLVAPDIGNIETTLSPEDKNWTPKRRASFLMPSFVAAGLLHIRVVVKDQVAKAETSRDFPFQLGGHQIHPSPTITIEDFGFLRNQNDQKSLSVPAFSPGDTVFGHFDIVGFHYAPGNRYHLAYGLTVLRPDGKTFLNQPKAAELSESSFYPAQFVPGNINITTPPNSIKGEYVLTLTVRDLIANQTYESKQAFSIE
jgi:hypothetical protein